MNRQQKRAFKKEHGYDPIDPERQNAGGFYEGMAGVFIDEHGNRRMMEVSVTPDAEVVLRLGAHPVQINECNLSLMDTSPMFRQMILQCVKRYKREQFIGRVKSKLIQWWRYIKLKLSFSREQENENEGKSGDKSLDIVK